VGLVCGSHPGAQPLVEQDVFGVEGFELRILSGADFLRHEVVGAQVEGQADDADAAGPQAHHRHEEHEEVKPALVGEGDPEDLAPETVGGHHRVGLFFLGGLESPEGVGLLAIFKKGVFHCCAMDGTKESTAENAGHAHHVEGVEGPVVKALQEEQEAENGCHPEGRSKEPAALTQGVHQEDTDEHRDGPGEGDGVIGTDAHQASNFKLAKHEADQSESTMESHEGPQATQLAPAHEIPLGFWAPEEKKAVTHRISRSADGGGDEIATFQVGAGYAVGVPGSDEGGSGEPTAKCQVGTGEEQQTRPPHENEAVALKPVVEDVKPSPSCWRASYSDRHGKKAWVQQVGNLLGCVLPGDGNNVPVAPGKVYMP
jgi:hypothetical protein